MDKLKTFNIKTLKSQVTIAVLVYTLLLLLSFIFAKTTLLGATSDAAASRNEVKASGRINFTYQHIGSYPHIINGNNNYVYSYTYDTGIKLILLGFQPKEIVTITDSQEYGARSDSDYKNKQFITGYTITDGFTATGQVVQPENTIPVFADFGKLYAEYGTVGMTNLDESVKRDIITSVLETDFEGQSIPLNNAELLNGLAYRSAVLTEERYKRSIVYVPKSAVTKNLAPANASLELKTVTQTPFAAGFFSRAWAYQGNEKGENIEAILDTKNTMFLDNNNLYNAYDLIPQNDGQKYTHDLASLQIKKGIAYAWPIVYANNSGNITVSIASSFPTSNVAYTIKTPYATDAYVLEGAEYYSSKYSREEIANRLDHLATLDTHEPIAGIDPDEDTYIETYMRLYDTSIDYAYSVLDAVFGGIDTEFGAVGTFVSHKAPGHNYACTALAKTGKTISFKTRYDNWLQTSSDLVRFEDDPAKCAALRQAQFHCALASIIKFQRGIPDVDPKSNVEIALMSVYCSWVGGIGEAKYSNAEFKDNYPYYYQQKYGHIPSSNNKGKAATLLGAGFCFTTTTETMASFMYDWPRELKTDTGKLLTLAMTGIRSVEGKTFTLGSNGFSHGLSGADTFVRTVQALGNFTHKVDMRAADDTASTTSLQAGVEFLYGTAFTNKFNVSGADKSFVCTDQLRQIYTLTIAARGMGGESEDKQSLSKVNLFNYGLLPAMDGLGITARANLDSTFFNITDQTSSGYSYTKGYSRKYLINRTVNSSGTGLKTGTLYVNGTGVSVSAAQVISQSNGTSSSSSLNIEGPATLPSYQVAAATRAYRLVYDIKGGSRAQNLTTFTEPSGLANYAANNMIYCNFTTFIPSTESRKIKQGVLSETQIDAYDDNTVVANGTNFYLYNRAYYKPTEDYVNINTVLGFKEKTDTWTDDGCKIIHQLSPSKMDDYELAVGLNFSKGAIELFEDLLSKGKTPIIQVKLNGADGNLLYVDEGDEVYKKSSYTSASKLNSLDKDFGYSWSSLPSPLLDTQIKKILNENYSDIPNSIYWGSETTHAYDNFIIGTYAKDTTRSQGDILTLRITDDILNKIKTIVNENGALLNADDYFTWGFTDSASKSVFDLVQLIGPNGEKLGDTDAPDTLSATATYLCGATAQLFVADKYDASKKAQNIAYAPLTEGTNAKQAYTNKGLGVYHDLYTTTAFGTGMPSMHLIANVKNGASDVASDRNTNTTKSKVKQLGIDNEYGDGTNNHMYFSFMTETDPGWAFSGTVETVWKVNYDHILPTRAENSRLASDAVANFEFMFKGEALTEDDAVSVKEFYDKMVANNVDYIAITVCEEPNREMTYTMKEGGTPQDLVAPNWNRLVDRTPNGGLSGGKGTFFNGSVIYKLDDFIELLGGKDNEELEAKFSLKGKVTSEGFKNMLARYSNSGPNEFDNNRIELDFRVSFYGLGTPSGALATSLANAAATNELVLSQNNTSGIITKVASTDKTNGAVCIDVTNNMKFPIMSGSTKNYSVAVNLAKNYGHHASTADTKLAQMIATAGGVIWYCPPSGLDRSEGKTFASSYYANYELDNIYHKTSNVYTIHAGNDGTEEGDAYLVVGSAVIEPKHVIIRTTSPVAYAQIKQGVTEWSQTDAGTVPQQWNVMTGVPSTEKLYITTGGSEFILEMSVEEVLSEKAYRSYTSTFLGVDCKFRKGDTSSAGGNDVTQVQKNLLSHEYNNMSVEVTDWKDTFNLPKPVNTNTDNTLAGNWAVTEHAGQKISATWTGTIANSTTDPGVAGYKNYVDNIESAGTYDLGHPGKMTPGGQANKNGYSWNVDAYNAALQDAVNWSNAMQSNGKLDRTLPGNIIIKSDSDRVVRKWYCGDATISISLNGVIKAADSRFNERDTIAYKGTWADGTTDTNNYTAWKLASNDDRLSSGYFEVHGSHALTYSSCKTASTTVKVDGTNCDGNESHTGTWNDEKDLKAFRPTRNTVPVTTSYSANITCNATTTPTTTPSATCTCIPTGTTTNVFYDSCWCGHNNGSGLSNASYTFTPCDWTIKDDADDKQHYERTHEHTFTTTNGNTTLGTHTCTASHTWNCTETTTFKAPDVTFSITVEFNNSKTTYEGSTTWTDTTDSTVDEHCLCGPCCSHYLPAISDKWVQWFTYNSARIVDVRLSKISRSYIAGVNDITLDYKADDYLLGTIGQGDVNVFCNIAMENTTFANHIALDGYYKKRGSTANIVAGASLSGRIRHSLQAQAHDEVYWVEQIVTKAGGGSGLHRTQDCDGKAATLSLYNPRKDGGTGHGEPWALGILYSRLASVNAPYGTYEENPANNHITYYQGYYNNRFNYSGYYTHGKNFLTNSTISTKKSGYTNNSLDSIDTQTVEFERFYTRRNLINDVTLLSDILVLQGTEGDTAIVDGETTSRGRTTEEDHGKDVLSVTLSQAVSQPYATILNGNIFNEQSYTYAGRGAAVEVTGSNILYNISAQNGNLVSGYFGNGYSPSLDTQRVKYVRKTVTALDSNGKATDATIQHADEIKPIAGFAYKHTLCNAVCKPALTYVEKPHVDDSMNGEDYISSSAKYEKRAVSPDKPLRIGKLNIQIDPTTSNSQYLTEVAKQSWVLIKNYTEPEVDDKYKLEKVYYLPAEGADTQTFEDRPALVQEAYYYGNTATGYLPPEYKVNDLIIHTPISAQITYMVPAKDNYDQRTKEKKQEYNGTKKCPGTADLCEYAYLDCDYFKQKTLLSTNFNPRFTIGTNTYDSYTINGDGYLTSLLDQTALKTIGITAGKATAISDGAGNGIALNGTSIDIPLDGIGIPYTSGVSFKLQFAGNFTADTRLFNCGNITANFVGSSLVVTNGVYTTKFEVYSPTNYHSYELILGYDTFDQIELYQDGAKRAVLSTNTTDVTSTYNPSDWSEKLSFGERCKLYYFNVVKLPGAAEHTAGCYATYKECEQVVNYTCDAVTRFTEGKIPNKFTAAVDGMYLLEIYNGYNKYNTMEIPLKKGESIYAYLGNAFGYWSKTDTDHESTYAYSESGTKLGRKNVSALATPVDMLRTETETAVTKNVTLAPGLYRISAVTTAGTGVSGWYSCKESTTLTVTVDAAKTVTVAKGSTVILSDTIAHSYSLAGVKNGRTDIEGKPEVSIVKYVDLAGISPIYDIGYTVTDTLNGKKQDLRFDFTGTIQNITLKPGTYQFTLAGAAGGGNTSDNIGSRLGQGGITKATATFTEDTSLVLNVGGQGETALGTAHGGYNGGGSANYNYYPIGAGGGATDISVNGYCVTPENAGLLLAIAQPGTEIVDNTWVMHPNTGIHVHTNENIKFNTTDLYWFLSLKGSNLSNVLASFTHSPNAVSWTGGGATLSYLNASDTSVQMIVKSTTTDPYLAFCIYNRGASDAVVTSISMNELNSRILVAGGGGGSDDVGAASGELNGGNDESGGHGGGFVGGNPTTMCAQPVGVSYGGNQFGSYANAERIGGYFGYGGTCQDVGKDYGGGGAGWFGGSSGGNGYQGGAGGSSYVSGAAGCSTLQLGRQTIGGKTITFTDVSMEQGGNKGNGYIIIGGGSTGSGTVGSVELTDVYVSTDVTTSSDYTTYMWNADQSQIILSSEDNNFEFSYTGAVQRITLTPGTYRFEAWGASGGGYNPAALGISSRGGQGGYTQATYKINTTTTVYVYVGQAGSYGAGDNAYGGPNTTFNGGGAGGNSGSGSGGGATDFRLVGGSWDNTEGLKSRFLVAGGGGGSDNRNDTSAAGTADDGSGGAGGGLVSQTAFIGGVETPGYNAGQNYGYAFGIGGSATNGTDTGGAGGGYYGGRVTNNNNGGAGGGSSYVSGYTGCDTTYRAYQKVGGANLTPSDVSVQVGGNTGNGKAIITKLSIDNSSTNAYDVKDADGYKWVKVFRHDTSGGLFESNAEALHTGTKDSKKYSILDMIDQLKSAADKKYVFKLYYPEYNASIIWKQNENPLAIIEAGNTTSTGKQVAGYETIRTDYTGNYWGGLVRSSTGCTLLDGSTYHGNWFYAIGANTAWGTGAPGTTTIPGGNSQAVTKVELYIATDASKLAETSAFNDLLTYAPTVKNDILIPRDSPYAQFVISPTRAIAQVRLIDHKHTAECPHTLSEFNHHNHTIDCMDTTSPVYKWLLYRVRYTEDSTTSRAVKTYLGVDLSTLGSTMSERYNTLLNKRLDFSKIPQLIDGNYNPIFSCQGHNDEHVHTAVCNEEHSTLVCNNPHHSGEHYEFGNAICYKPCLDDEKHKKTEVTIGGENFKVGDMVNLEGYFHIYWPNTGDFYETGKVASTVLEQSRGQGYVQGMDTTRWTKRKFIRFDAIDVLFFNIRTNKWELHTAGTDIELPVVTDGTNGNGDDDGDDRRDWRNPNQTPVEYYEFYCLLDNNEYSGTAYTVWSEALNAKSSDGQADKPYTKNVDAEQDSNTDVTNKKRHPKTSGYTSYHTDVNGNSFDVVGNIGNFIITYTTDYRWSNFFKAEDTSGWQTENILFNIYEDRQKQYVHIGKNADSRDIHNTPIADLPTHTKFDTWNTEEWKKTAVNYNTYLGRELLGSQTGYTWHKLANELKCGYDIFCEITTTGDYENVEARYSYFVMDKRTGDVSKVDLWSNVAGNRQAYYLAEENPMEILNILNSGSLNGYYGIAEVDSLAVYYLYNELNVQKQLRMVTEAQISKANELNAKFFTTEGWTKHPEDIEYDENGNAETMASFVSPKIIQNRVKIGTAYGVELGASHRVFVGSSYNNRTMKYTHGTETNIGSVLDPDRFEVQARRWIFTAGTAENTIAVKYDGTTHIDLTHDSLSDNIIKDRENYVLLVGVDVYAYGRTWNLEYEGWTTEQPVCNKYLDTSIPDIIAVYDLNSKEDDFDVEQSH